MAIGAFTSALLVARSGWPLEPAVLAGTAAALVAGVLCGGVVRLRRAFVAVSTWLLAWLVWLYLLAFPSVSGGSQGLILPPRSLLGLDATPTVHFEVALALTALTALAVAAVRRGAPGLELSGCARRRPWRPRSASGSPRGGSARSRRPRRSPGWRAGSPCSCRRSPTRSATTRSSRSSCSWRCCSAAPRRRWARGRRDPARPDRAGLGPACARAAAPARAVRRGGRGDPARVRARLRRPGRRALGPRGCAASSRRSAGPRNRRRPCPARASRS